MKSRISFLKGFRPHTALIADSLTGWCGLADVSRVDPAFKARVAEDNRNIGRETPCAAPAPYSEAAYQTALASQLLKAHLCRAGTTTRLTLGQQFPALELHAAAGKAGPLEFVGTTSCGDKLAA